MPKRGGADDKGGTRPRNQVGAGFGASERAMIIRDVGGGFGFGGCSGCVGCGVVFRDMFRIDLVEDHDGGWVISVVHDGVVV